MRRSRFFALTSVSLAALMALATAVEATQPAVQMLGVLKPKEQWKVGTVDSSGAPYCAMVGKFDQASTLAFARSVEGFGSLGIEFFDDLFKPGKKYEVTLTLENLAPRTFSGEATTARSLVLQIGEDDALYDTFSRSDTLRVTTSAIDVRFAISKFGKNYKELVTCATVLAGPQEQVDLPPAEMAEAAAQSGKITPPQAEPPKVAASPLAPFKNFFQKLKAKPAEQEAANAAASMRQYSENDIVWNDEKSAAKTAAVSKKKSDQTAAVTLPLPKPAAPKAETVIAAAEAAPDAVAAPAGAVEAAALDNADTAEAGAPPERKLLASMAVTGHAVFAENVGMSAREMEKIQSARLERDMARKEQEIATLASTTTQNAQQQVQESERRQEAMLMQAEGLQKQIAALEKAVADRAAAAPAAAAVPAEKAAEPKQVADVLAAKQQAEALAQKQAEMNKLMAAREEETRKLAEALSKTEQDFNARLATLEGERNVLRGQLETALSESRTVVPALETAKREGDTKIRALEEKLGAAEEARASLRQQLADAETANKDLAESLKLQQAERAKAEDALRRANELEAQLAAQIRQAKELELALAAEKAKPPVTVEVPVEVAAKPDPKLAEEKAQLESRLKAEVAAREAEAQRLAALEAERQAETARLAKLEEERKAEAIRIANLEAERRAEAERAAKLEAERAAETARAERLEAARKADAELAAKLEAERKAEADRLAKLEAARALEAERIAKAEVERKAEAERVAKLEAERKAEAERVAKLEAERKAEAERVAKLEVERKAEAERVAKLEAERKAEAERVAKLEAERKAEAERVAKLEAERKAEAERVAKLEAERKAEADRVAKLEAERKAEAERVAKLEVERKAEAERIAKLEEERRLQAERTAVLAQERDAARLKAEAEIRALREEKAALEQKLALEQKQAAEQKRAAQQQAEATLQKAMAAQQPASAPRAVMAKPSAQPAAVLPPLEKRDIAVVPAVPPLPAANARSLSRLEPAAGASDLTSGGNRAEAFLEGIMKHHRPQGAPAPKAAVPQPAVKTPVVPALQPAARPQAPAVEQPALRGTAAPAQTGRAVSLETLLEQSGVRGAVFQPMQQSGGEASRQWTLGRLSGLYEQMPAAGQSFDRLAQDYIGRYRDDCPQNLTVKLGAAEQTPAGTVANGTLSCSMPGNAYETSMLFVQSGASFAAILHSGNPSDAAQVKSLGDNIFYTLSSSAGLSPLPAAPAAPVRAAMPKEDTRRSVMSPEPPVSAIPLAPQTSDEFETVVVQ